MWESYHRNWRRKVKGCGEDESKNIHPLNNSLENLLFSKFFGTIVQVPIDVQANANKKVPVK